ncbi:MAG: NAD(P)H-dependent oxidoreductase [Oscillospiraceae bacterium]|nr:NAD(P)H-dependent oxidoreductase [Oscillospiraceae bacterium]
MKTLILFHSYTGKTKALAERKAAELMADIEEIKTVRRPSKFGAFVVGIPSSIGRKKAKIHPIKSSFDEYDKIVLMSPVWAGHTTPAVNSAIDCIPSGKRVEVIMVSSSGETDESADRIKALIYNRGCEVTDYTDVKA